MPEYTEEQKAKRISHFRRIIKYRIWFGWVFALVGLSLFAAGPGGEQINRLVAVNGSLFSGYGLFMVRQAKRALSNLSQSTTE